MKYCPFLQWSADTGPRSCLGIQCMLWSERSNGCSLGESRQAGIPVKAPAPVDETRQVVTPASVENRPTNAPSGFDTWYQNVKNGSDDPVQAGLDDEHPYGGHLTGEELDDADIEMLMATEEPITCEGCGRQLPKGAMWCPECNGPIK